MFSDFRTLFEKLPFPNLFKCYFCLFYVFVPESAQIFNPSMFYEKKIECPLVKWIFHRIYYQLKGFQLIDVSKGTHHGKSMTGWRKAPTKLPFGRWKLRFGRRKSFWPTRFGRWKYLSAENLCHLKFVSLVDQYKKREGLSNHDCN